MLLIYYHNGIVNTCITCGEHWLNMWLTGQERHPFVKKTLLQYSWKMMMLTEVCEPWGVQGGDNRCVVQKVS